MCRGSLARLWLIGFLLLPQCGSDDSGGGAGSSAGGAGASAGASGWDAGHDAQADSPSAVDGADGQDASEESAVTDQTTPDQSAEAGTPNEQYCAVKAAHNAKCGKNSPCDQAKEAACLANTSMLSDFLMNATNECYAQLQPACGEESALGSCIGGKAVDPTLSSLQDKMIGEYCFWCTVAQETHDHCVGRIGQSILPYSDALLTQLVQTCPLPETDAGEAQCLAFMDCWDKHEPEVPVPAACLDGG